MTKADIFNLFLTEVGLDASGVYALKCKETNRVYIGQSKRLLQRLVYHLQCLAKNRHHCSDLQSDYNAYGLGAFAFEIRYVGVSLDAVERREIREAMRHSPKPYNSTLPKTSTQRARKVAPFMQEHLASLERLRKAGLLEND